MLSAVNQYVDIYQSTESHFSGESGSVAIAQKTNESEPVRQQDQGLSGQDKPPSGINQKDVVELSKEAEEIRTLQLRDREVRAHEAAHAAAGGSYAGSPTYSFERGPDGHTYATGGAVSIDISPIAGDPQATLQKAQQVQAAALAPAEPSGQDMKVAQKAQAMAAEARIDIARQRSEDLKSLKSEPMSGKNFKSETNAIISVEPSSTVSPAISAGGDASSIVHLSIYS